MYTAVTCLHTAATCLHTAYTLLTHCRYGLYLVHWVLIVWFGDSALNTAHSETTLHGRQEGYGPLARDVAIAIASVVISTASFFMFEVPVSTGY